MWVREALGLLRGAVHALYARRCQAGCAFLASMLAYAVQLDAASGLFMQPCGVYIRFSCIWHGMNWYEMERHGFSGLGWSIQRRLQLFVCSFSA